MKLSKHLSNSQLSSKKDELQSEIYDLEKEFIFIPDNIDENPDNYVQKIIQDRIKALDLLTSGIQELTQNYTSRFENNNTNKTKSDGMSDLTMDETENNIQEANTETLQNNQEKERNNQGKIRENHVTGRVQTT